MSAGEIIGDIIVGLMVLAVGGLGIGSVIYSYAEEARAKAERRRRALERAQASKDSDSW